MRLTARTFLLAVLTALAPFMGGCGGAGSSGFDPISPVISHSMARGSVAVQIAWPRALPTRVVPGATQSIRIEARRGATVLASTLLISPATTATLTEISTGAVTVRATAYANASGTGVALATADVASTVSDGTTSSVTVPMASTVQTVTVSPASVTIVLSILTYRQLTPTAKDGGNATVPVATDDWEYSSSAPLIASVDSSGRVVGILPGSATITVRERTSGRTATVPTTIVL